LLAPLWLLSFAGVIGLPSHLGLVGWHAHEMLFGYTAAVIAGFMLTATSNWTRLPTLRGLPIGACGFYFGWLRAS
jgi:uncharacterized protein involved in response to NO